MKSYIGRCSGLTDEFLTRPILFHDSKDTANVYAKVTTELLGKCKGEDVVVISLHSTSPLILEWIKFLNDDLNLNCGLIEKRRIIYIPRDKHTSLSFDLTVNLLRYIYSERITILKQFKFLNDTFKSILEPITILQLAHYITPNYNTVVCHSLITQNTFNNRINKCVKYSTLFKGDIPLNYEKLKNALNSRNKIKFENLCHIKNIKFG